MFSRKINNPKSLINTNYVFVLCMILVLGCFKSYRWNGPEKKSVITSDGIGYYAYLPATFINKNLNDHPQNSTYTNQIDGKNVNKYFVGTSVAMSPFFFAGHAIAKTFNYKADGYSAPYQFSIGIAALFYLFFGLFCLTKLLSLYQITRKNIAITIVLILFGTNLLYYSVYDCSMAHVYSFSLIAFYALIVKQLTQNHKIKHLYLAAFLFALITLIRPTNGIVILFPLILSNSSSAFKHTIQFFSKNWRHVALSVVLIIGVLSVQLFVWHQQTGKLFLWSYSQEGFYFQNPQFLAVLFSFKKGLFIYSPVLLISLMGMTALYRYSKFHFFTLSSFFILLIYLISSWWNWYYGDSFGHRAFIDYYALFAIPLAMLIQKYFMRNRIKILLSISFIFCVSLNAVQSHQYYAGIMHRYSMNAEKYAYIFFKTANQYKNSLGGNLDIKPFSKHDKTLLISTLNTFDKDIPNWTNTRIEKSANSQNQYGVYKSDEFGISYSIKNNSTLFNAQKIFVEASLKRKNIDQAGSSEVRFVVQVKNAKQGDKYYYSFKINDTPKLELDTWQKLNYTFNIPKLSQPDDEIIIYLWNKEKQSVAIDDFEINFYAID